eukprot:11450770-Alexandrium_andersonii.AAC.1
MRRMGVHEPAIAEELEMQRIHEDMLASVSKHVHPPVFLGARALGLPQKAARHSSPVDARAWQSPLL